MQLAAEAAAALPRALYLALGRGFAVFAPAGTWSFALVALAADRTGWPYLVVGSAVETAQRRMDYWHRWLQARGYLPAYWRLYSHQIRRR